MRIARWAATIAAALVVGTCLPVTTKAPVGSTAGFAFDSALIGVWRSTEKGKAEFIVFVKNNDGSMDAILPSDDSWMTFSLKTAKLGAHTFMTVREVLVDGKPADDDLAGKLLPCLYSVKGNTLTLSLLDEKETAAAIRAGSIPGTIDPGEYGDVHLTADANTLDVFMQSQAGLSLFGKPALVLKRVD